MSLFFQSCPATNPATKSGNERQNTFKIKPLLLFLSPAFSSISSLLSLPYTIFLIYIFIKNLIIKGLAAMQGSYAPATNLATNRQPARQQTHKFMPSTPPEPPPAVLFRLTHPQILFRCRAVRCRGRHVPIPAACRTLQTSSDS